MSQSFPNSHHRPVGVDGDVGAVVVEDGAGAVDDFLVALDLRHDLLLHLQRRQGDLEVRHDTSLLALAANPPVAGHLSDRQRLVNSECMTQK